jgi:hypothetical protein
MDLQSILQRQVDQSPDSQCLLMTLVMGDLE